MKRSLCEMLCIGSFIFSLQFPILAQSANSMVLSKDASGPITRVFLSLTLRSNATCDATATLIPDGSRLVSDSFSMRVDATGIGVFRGLVRIITPEGRPILAGFLHGTVGTTTHREPGKDCRAPRHLEGVLEALRPGSASVFEVNFSADEITEIASPLPTYRARLDGLVVPPLPLPPDETVRITSDRTEYTTVDPITAVISNHAEHAIQSLDEQSYCTIVQLQRQAGDQWVLTAPCPLARPPVPVNIGAGETKLVRLPPGPQASEAKEPGVYRLALTFTGLDENGKPIGHPLTIFSPLFRVNPPPAVGGVTITTNQNSYRGDERIVATIKNDTDQSIQTADHRSWCTVLFLQRKVGDMWSNLALCRLLTPTRLITIGPRQSLSVALPPEPALPQHEAGTYRVELSFWFLDSSGRPTGQPVVSDSPPFSVQTAPVLPPEKLNALVAIQAAAESYAVISNLLDFPDGAAGEWSGSYNRTPGDLDWAMDFIGTAGGKALRIALRGSFIPGGIDRVRWTGEFNVDGVPAITTTGTAVFCYCRDGFEWNHLWNTTSGDGGITGEPRLTGSQTGGTITVAHQGGITGVIQRGRLTRRIVEQIIWDQNTGSLEVTAADDAGQPFVLGVGTIDAGTISLRVKTVVGS